MNEPVILALRAEGTATVLDALRSVRQAQVAAEEASISGARSAAQRRLAILTEELSTKVKMHRIAEQAVEDGMRRTLGMAGPGARASLAGSNTYGTIASGTGFRDIDRAVQIMAQKGDMIAAAAALFKGGLDLATAGLKQFASFVLSDVVKPAMALETRATQMANASGGTMTATGIQAQARAAGIRNNIDPMQILEHAGALRELTGDAGLSMAMMPTIGMISKGRGVDMADLTKFAGGIYQPGMKQADLERALLTQVAMGEKGGISIDQMAKLGPRFLAPMAGLAGNQETRLAEVGALIQSAKGLGAGGRRAAGVASFVEEALKHGGPQVLTDASGERKLADPAKLIGDLLASTGGDMGKLKGAGFTGAGAKLVASYREQFQGAFGDAKARGEDDTQARKDAGKAVEDFIKKFATASTTMEAEESKRNSVMETSGQKFEHAMDEIKEKLLVAKPSIDKFIDSFVSHSDEIGTAAVALVDIMTLLGDAVLAAVEWYDNLVNKHGDGDVLKTVRDKGSNTAPLPRMDDKGYWLQDKGLYKYIKGSSDPSVDDTKNKGLELAYNLPSGAKIMRFQGGVDPFSPEGRAKAKKELDLGMYGPRADQAYAEGPRADAGATAGATGAGHADADAKAKALAGSLDKLQTKIDTLASSMDGLNRSEAFSPGP